MAGGTGDHSERIEGLEGRNRFDDKRQDESDRRQDRAEEHVAGVRETVAAVQDTIVTLRDVYNIADKRMDRLERLCERVTTTTDHRLERYERWVLEIDQRITKWMSKMEELLTGKANVADLDRKADKTQLLTSLVFRWFNFKWIRWMVGALFLAVFTTAATQHWFLWLANWIEGLFP